MSHGRGGRVLSQIHNLLAVHPADLALSLRDLYVRSARHADRLCSELARVPADNPIFRLLVVRRFLLDHGPRQNDECLMRWARRLRDTYADSGRLQMRWAVFCALYRSFFIDNRHRGGDRRLRERRLRRALVQIERLRPGDRRQQGLRALYVQSNAHANRLCSELAKVPADNPISRLLVVQRFLLDHGPRQNHASIMRWARRLRDTYSDSDPLEMRWAVLCALHLV